MSSTLILCPSCGRQSFDRIARACERRKCGFAEDECRHEQRLLVWSRRADGFGWRCTCGVDVHFESGRVVEEQYLESGWSQR
jgi:ribosomal protein L37E